MPLMNRPECQEPRLPPTGSQASRWGIGGIPRGAGGKAQSEIVENPDLGLAICSGMCYNVSVKRTIKFP